MPNIGGGTGTALKAALAGFDSGSQWTRDHRQAKRQAAIDAENLRGAGITNTENEKQSGRNDNLHPGELELQEIDALYKLGSINFQEANTRRTQVLTEISRAEEGRNAIRFKYEPTRLGLNNDLLRGNIRQQGATYDSTVAGTEATRDGNTRANRKLPSELGLNFAQIGNIRANTAATQGGEQRAWGLHPTALAQADANVDATRAGTQATVDGNNRENLQLPGRMGLTAAQTGSAQASTVATLGGEKRAWGVYAKELLQADANLASTQAGTQATLAGTRRENLKLPSELGLTFARTAQLTGSEQRAWGLQPLAEQQAAANVDSTIANTEATTAQTAREEQLQAGRMEIQALSVQLTGGQITATEFANRAQAVAARLAEETGDSTIATKLLSNQAQQATDAGTITAAGAEADARVAVADGVVATTPSATDAEIAANTATVDTAGLGALADNAESGQRIQEAGVATQVSEDEEERRQLEKPQQDRLNSLKMEFNVIEQEQANLDQGFDVEGKAITNPQQLEQLRDETAEKGLINLLAQHSINPAGTAARLNDSEVVDIDGVVRTDVIDGVFRAYDAEGNIAVDKSDDPPSPVEWNVRALTKEMMRKRFPETADAVIAEVEALADLEQIQAKANAERDPREQASVLNSMTPQIRDMATEHAKNTYGVQPYEDGTYEYSPEMQREMQDIAARTSQHDASKVPALDSFNSESKHPHLAQRLQGYGVNATQMYDDLEEAVQTRRAAGDDVTRLSLMEDMVRYYEQVANQAQQAQNAQAPGGSAAPAPAGFPTLGTLPPQGGVRP